MSKYRVKHFMRELPSEIEVEVNDFIAENNIEVLKYTLIPLGLAVNGGFLAILEYEVEDDQ